MTAGAVDKSAGHRRHRAIERGNHLDLIEAFSRIAGRHEDARLMIVGGGSLHARLRQRVDALRLRARVDLTGRLPYQEAIRAIDRMHCYVQASSVEGCSLGVLEAQARALPLVLSYAGAARLCVEAPLNGYLFPPGDVDALPDKLLVVLSTAPGRREMMGRHGLDILRLRFLFESQMERIESILEAVHAIRAIPE